MKIGVVTEGSTADKNKDVIEALQGLGHEIINAGMKKAEGGPELNYIETALIGAILLELKAVDFIVGGCGTGQGFVNAIVQFPGVSCGLIQEPADAWLFARINGGNSISLSLNKGYGWAGNINLKFIFEKLFSVESGSGYPEHRKLPQEKARKVFASLSAAAHKPFHSIIEDMDGDLLKKALSFPGVWELVKASGDSGSKTRKALEKRYAGF